MVLLLNSSIHSFTPHPIVLSFNFPFVIFINSVFVIPISSIYLSVTFVQAICFDVISSSIFLSNSFFPFNIFIFYCILHVIILLFISEAPISPLSVQFAAYFGAPNISLYTPFSMRCTFSNSVSLKFTKLHPYNIDGMATFSRPSRFNFISLLLLIWCIKTKSGCYWIIEGIKTHAIKSLGSWGFTCAQLWWS